ncbi:MAG: antitoxin [Betaproteobacteria bacterium]|nr:antitoxin [Betaproteobacteria bacterium]
METTVFTNKRTQAVRLPKAVAFPEGVKHVEVIAVGRTRIIAPKGECWDSWFDEQPGASADLMAERGQAAEQIREGF